MTAVLQANAIVSLLQWMRYRKSPPEVFIEKGVLKICSKFSGEHPCRGAISIKLLCNFIEIALRHGCSPANLLHIFRTHFPDNTSGGLFLKRPDLIPNVTSYICSTYFMKNTINYSKLFTSISHFLLVSLSWQCCQSFLVFGFLECIKHSN